MMRRGVIDRPTFDVGIMQLEKALGRGKEYDPITKKDLVRSVLRGLAPSTEEWVQAVHDLVDHEEFLPTVRRIREAVLKARKALEPVKAKVPCSYCGPASLGYVFVRADHPVMGRRSIPCLCENAPRNDGNFLDFLAGNQTIKRTDLCDHRGKRIDENEEAYIRRRDEELWELYQRGAWIPADAEARMLSRLGQGQPQTSLPPKRALLQIIKSVGKPIEQVAAPYTRPRRTGAST